MNIQILKDTHISGMPRHVVTVDGESRIVDLTNFNGRVVTWDGAAGNLMHADLTVEAIADITPYQSFIDAWHALTVIQPPLTLDDFKETKRTEIRNAYEASCILPVLAIGILWEGGFESAIKLDAAKRLNEAAGIQSVIFYDTYNIGHELDFFNAMTVIITVAERFQMKLAKKQAYFALIKLGENESDLSNIAWEED